MRLFNTHKQVVVFFLITYGITWILWLPLILFDPPIKFFHQIGGMGPLVGAFLTTFLFEGRAGVKQFIQRIGHFQLKWVLIAFFTPFILFLIAALFPLLTHGTVPNFGQLLQSKEYPTIGIAYWVISIICYGFGEQVGWRGFALPHLTQKGLNPLSASTILSIFWAVWHLPLFWYHESGYYLMNGLTILGWYISLLLSSYLLTWLFNTSKKSIVAVAVFHGAIDIVVISKAAQGEIVQTVSIILMLCGILVVLLTGKSLVSPKAKLRY